MSISLPTKRPSTRDGIVTEMNGSVTFWGVRGSFATPMRSHMDAGGNTACVEVRTAHGDLFVLDAGTGIRDLGRSLLESRSGGPLQIRILLSHFHWDHICGLFSFEPLYLPEVDISFLSGLPAEQARKNVRSIFRPPYFPIHWDDTLSQKTFIDASARTLRLGNTEIRAFPVNHCPETYGYRCKVGNASIVYVPDVEHGVSELDAVLRENCYGADLLIIDAHYTPEEYQKYRGRGHTTWLDSARLSDACAVKALALFHHSPEHDDNQLLEILSRARDIFKHTCLAREGTTIQV